MKKSIVCIISGFILGFCLESQAAQRGKMPYWQPYPPKAAAPQAPLPVLAPEEQPIVQTLKEKQEQETLERARQGARQFQFRKHINRGKLPPPTINPRLGQ